MGGRKIFIQIQAHTERNSPNIRGFMNGVVKNMFYVENCILYASFENVQSDQCKMYVNL